MENLDDIDISSNLLAQTLGKAMNTDIKYICYCFIRRKLDENKKGCIPNVPVIVCLGKKDIFIFKDNFKNASFLFSYDSIDHIVIEDKNKYSLMIVLNDKKIPYVNLTIPDRNVFIESLMCYYSVFYISDKKKMKDLVIKKRDKLLFLYQSKNHIEYLKLYNMPPSYYRVIINLNYL